MTSIYNFVVSKLSLPRNGSVGLLSVAEGVKKLVCVHSGAAMTELAVLSADSVVVLAHDERTIRAVEIAMRFFINED